MAHFTRLTASLFLLAALSFAGTWSGSLVDSKCYASEQRNVNPTDTLTLVDRDQNLAIRYCSAKSKTKSFAIVQHNGVSLQLDIEGNAKAAALVQKSRKRSPFAVDFTGEILGTRVKLDSIRPQ